MNVIKKSINKRLLMKDAGDTYNYCTNRDSFKEILSRTWAIYKKNETPWSNTNKMIYCMSHKYKLDNIFYSLSKYDLKELLYIRKALENAVIEKNTQIKECASLGGWTCYLVDDRSNIIENLNKVNYIINL
jgi:hypothetical protein